MEPLPEPAAEFDSVAQAPRPIREGCWLVGFRNPNSLLQCNTYLRSFDQGGSKVHVCVDPGSQIDYPVVEGNLQKLLGDVGEIHSFSLNHQDPDVVGNAAYLCEANPNVSVLVTEDTWRLVRHWLLTPKRVHFMNAAHAPAVHIGDQRRWRLVPTPFCHFRGAMAFYDLEQRVLFSGDLFGGLNLLGQVHVEAREQDWPGVAQFHQIYMPQREALRYAVRQIRALRPAVEVIAPQHGYVITGDMVPLYLDRLHELLVGFDLLAVELDENYLAGYREALAEIIDHAAHSQGRDEVLARLRGADPPDGLDQHLAVKGSDAVLAREGYSALVKVFRRLAAREPVDWVNGLRSALLAACSRRNLPIPPIGAGTDDAGAPTTVGPEGIRAKAWWL